MSERRVIISADGHCGASIDGYKPYLESRYHDEFDAWAGQYHDAWVDLESDHSVDDRMGLAASAATYNWDSTKRQKHIDGQGIAAEVLYPNTSPPFSPSGQISAPGPRSAEEYEYRWAGLQAHNRWLVDFCADAPGRRAGIAQIYVEDVDAAVAEIRWAKEAGLMGVLLPGDHTLKLTNLFYPRFDAIWETCADLQMPIVRHATMVTELSEEAGPASQWVGMFENPFYNTRVISHLILAGVFERYPALKFVMAEIPDATKMPAYVRELDSMYESLTGDNPIGVFTDVLIREAVEALPKKPSEYHDTNCYYGNPFDFRHAHAAGVKNLMWGGDLPHSEGTSPFTKEALRLVFADLPDDESKRATSLTAADVFGFDMELLQRVADRIGPTVAELRTPLSDSERPKYPTETRSATFSLAGATP
jgi:predicted TIM-barrel fold metal-dependent hydrolase